MILCTGYRTSIIQSLMVMYPELRVEKIQRRTDEIYDFTEVPADAALVLAGGVLHGLSAEQHTRETMNEAFKSNYLDPMLIADQALSELPECKIVIIGSMSVFSGCFDPAYERSKKAMHSWIERQKVKSPQLLVGLAPPIIADSGMTRRRHDYPQVLEVRNHCYAADVAAKIYELLWKTPHPAINNMIVKLKPTHIREPMNE